MILCARITLSLQYDTWALGGREGRGRGEGRTTASGDLDMALPDCYI